MPDKPTLKDRLEPLFETPQKARVTIICALTALATLAAIITYALWTLGNSPEGDAPPGQSGAVSAAPEGDASPAPPEESVGTVGLVPALTIDEARALALTDAGLAEGEAEVSREALAEDNGLWVYEFRFHTADARYEYKINANTGAVRGKVKESYVSSSPAPSAPAQSAPPVQSAPPASAPPATQLPDNDVGLEGAKAAALADAGVSAAQAVFTKAERDYEDGVPVYDLEFHTSTHEYEYEILAASGGVYSRSVEALPTVLPSASPGSSTYIGIERAKAIALERAGLSAGQAVITHVQMDRDDGAVVYEIEFRQGRVEHEFKIDAVTGRILEYETDQG